LHLSARLREIEDHKNELMIELIGLTEDIKRGEPFRDESEG